MSQLLQITVPNSLLLILDPDIGELPTSLGSQPVVATPSAIAVGTLNEFDGETAVHLAVPSE